MKTKQGNLAEIALDVREAIKERATEEVTAEIALKREMYKEVRKNNRVNQEKYADFCFKLAILFITSSVVTCMTLYIKDNNVSINWIPVGAGLLLAFVSLYLAYYFLKQ